MAVNKVKILSGKSAALLIVSVVIIAITIVIVTKDDKSKPPTETRVAQLQPQTFCLPPCDEKGKCNEVLTIYGGPGTLHRLRGNAPYRAIANQLDGKRIIYDMPAGWESWTGEAPAGRLRLINAQGVKTTTLVEIVRVR